MDRIRIKTSRSVPNHKKLTKNQIKIIKTYLAVPDETLDLILRSIPPNSDPVQYIKNNFGNNDAILAQQLQEQEWNQSIQNVGNPHPLPPKRRPVLFPNKKPLIKGEEEQKHREFAENVPYIPHGRRKSFNYDYQDFVDPYSSQVPLEFQIYEEAKIRELEHAISPPSPVFMPPPSVGNSEEEMTYENLLELDKDLYNIGNGMSEQELSMIPEIPYNNSQSSKSCSVCQTDFEVGETVCLVTCFHVFHKDCIRNWLLRRRYCPVCQHKV